ncbi:MAG: hypothetical protein ACXVAY_01445 [Mucilaginibacter sp.]
MALKKAQEREYARVLYVSENLSNKELAERVGVTEKTIARWIEDGDWKRFRKSLLTTRQNQLNLMYDQLDWLNLEISMRDIRVASSKEADTIMKLTASIKNLEVETSIGEIVEVARDFIDFVRKTDLEMAKKITSLFDMFIQNKMR